MLVVEIDTDQWCLGDQPKTPLPGCQNPTRLSRAAKMHLSPLLNVLFHGLRKQHASKFVEYHILGTYYGDAQLKTSTYKERGACI